MSLQLSEVQTKTELTHVITVAHEAYRKPLNTFWEAFKGPSIAECSARQWSWHEAEPGSHWFKITDTETNQIVGGAQWIIHETNPFEKPEPPLQAYWWPEGEMKTMADQIMERFMANRPRRMNRPHVLLNTCFVLASQRHRGAGSLLMEWGCQKADQMGLESFVESTDDGRSLYKANGFVVVDHILLDPEVKEPSEKWEQLKKEIAPTPFPIFFMWRPKGGRFEEGKTVYSWEED